MSWFSRLFSSHRTKQSSDAILEDCAAVARKHGFSLHKEEWKHLLAKRERLAQSTLGGKYIHPDIFDALCLLCLFDALCEAGVGFMQNGVYDQAVETLGKAKMLLPWPSVLYSLMLAHTALGQLDVAKKLRRVALDGFESRSRVLAVLIPESVPSREQFIGSSATLLDSTGALLVGFPNMEEVKQALIHRGASAGPQ